MTYTGTIDQLKPSLFKLEKDVIYDIKVNKHRKKRGLKANNYAWSLMEQIARKMVMSKEEIYLKMLSSYGILKTTETGEIIESYFSPNVEPLSIGSYWKFIEWVNINGEARKKCYLLKGSSEYNSKEMYDFIQGIELEAKELDIETLSERELRLMIEEMERRENARKST